MKKNKCLMIGAIIQFFLFVGHIACLFCLNKMFEIYGISESMNEITTSYGTSAPYILTVVIAFCFLACGIYALSACGIIRKLPLLKLGLFTITIVFLLRTLWGISLMATGFTFLELSSTLAAALIGLLYLFGGIRYVRSNGTV